MKVKIENIIECKESDECTVIFSVSGSSYSAFGFNFDAKVGEVIDADLHHLEGNVSWEERFSKNNSRLKSLVHTGDWSYDAFGQIISINPVVADFGDIKLELGNFTHDSRVIGEYIYERIERLDICPK